MAQCFNINKNRCFDCKDERICYADLVMQQPSNFWTKTKEGCECNWKVHPSISTNDTLMTHSYHRNPMVCNLWFLEKGRQRG